MLKVAKKNERKEILVKDKRYHMSSKACVQWGST